MRHRQQASFKKSLGFSLLKGFQLMVTLALLGAFWLVPRLLASNTVPPGAEDRSWTPLRDDVHALSLDPVKVRADIKTVTTSSPDRAPLDARYVLWGRNVAYLHSLNVSNAWQPQGVPKRPARYRSFGGSRPGKADDCPQELANALPRGRAIENAVLTWRERTPQGQRQATLTVWRAVRASTGRLICVESSRTLPRP